MQIFHSLNNKNTEQMKRNLIEVTLRTMFNSAERFLELCEEPSIVTAKCTKKKCRGEALIRMGFLKDGSPTSAINI
jgi:hypothetical protein